MAHCRTSIEQNLGSYTATVLWIEFTMHLLIHFPLMVGCGGVGLVPWWEVPRVHMFGFT